MGSNSPPSPSPSLSPPARSRRRTPSFSVSESGSVKSESKLRARDKQDGVVERFMRSELSRGDYNFKKVWTHFREEGWRSQNGHELSYDHYYVKPGKSVKTGRRGEDFFLGERELVSYGLRMRIFGDPEEEPLGVASPSHVQEVLSQQQAQEKQQYDGDQEERDRSRRASRKRQRRASREQEDGASSSGRRSHQAKDAKKTEEKKKKHHRGARADDPISLLSGSSSGGSSASESEVSSSAKSGKARGKRRKVEVSSSSSSGDESWTGNDEKGGFDEPEDEDEDEEDSYSESDGEDSFDTQEDDDESEDEDEEQLDHGWEVRGEAPIAGGKFQAQDPRYQEKNSRPRLKTSTSSKQRAKGWKPPTDRQHHRTDESRKHERLKSNRRKQTSNKNAQGKQPLKHRKRSPSVSAESYFDDDTFSLGADRYGASPPRRPPTRAPRDIGWQPRRSAPSTPLGPPSTSSAKCPGTPRRSSSVSSTRARPASNSFLTPSTPVEDNSFDFGEDSADAFDCADTPPTAGDYEPPLSPIPSPSTPSPTTSTATSSSWTATPREPSTESSTTTAPATTLLELRDVAFPEDSDGATTSGNKYNVLVSTQRDGAICIDLENTRSRELLECTFHDVRELPGNAQQMVVPAQAVVEALLRCLRALPGAVVVNPGTLSDSKEDTGKIKLVEHSSEAETAPASASSPVSCADAATTTLRFTFPNYDFWYCHHSFPMKIVQSSQARIASLLAELEAVKARLSDANEQLEASTRDHEALKTRVEAVERERDTIQRTLADTEHKSQQALQELGSASQQQVAQLKAEVAQLEQEVEKLRAHVAQLESNLPASEHGTSEGDSADSPPSADAKQKTSKRHGNEGERPAARAIVQSPWLKALMPRVAEGVTRSTQLAMDWDVVVAVEKDCYGAVKDESTGRVSAITVRKSGTYQVNAHMAHEKNVRVALHIQSSSDEGDSGASASTKLVGASLLQMYDNKRRISRVDRVLSLHAQDQVSMVLLSDVSGSIGGVPSPPVGPCGEMRECWPPVFKPQANQLALTFLDAQFVYDSASASTSR